MTNSGNRNREHLTGIADLGMHHGLVSGAHWTMAPAPSRLHPLARIIEEESAKLETQRAREQIYQRLAARYAAD